MSSERFRAGLVAAEDGKGGCPVIVWDGPYSARCSLGRDRCAYHGPYETRPEPPAIERHRFRGLDPNCHAVLSDGRDCNGGIDDPRHDVPEPVLCPRPAAHDVLAESVADLREQEAARMASAVTELRAADTRFENVEQLAARIRNRATQPEPVNDVIARAERLAHACGCGDSERHWREALAR